MKIEGSGAHLRTQKRWLDAEGSIRDVLEKLDIKIDYDDVDVFVSPIADRYIRNGAPNIQAEVRARMTAGIVGLAVALAVVFVEQDRDLRGCQ